LAAVAIVAVGTGLAIGITTQDRTKSTAMVTVSTAPATDSPDNPACAGLSGTVVTDRPGDSSTSISAVVASFEYAYYANRDAARAMTVVAPEAGLSLDGLAAGIATIPVGTRHCVAITPIADTAADVHLAEVHPDRTRVDYLQVIDVRRTGADVQITNIQQRG
jgi:hypothetical protein